jgi:hypothetical protein
LDLHRRLDFQSLEITGSDFFQELENRIASDLIPPMLRIAQTFIVLALGALTLRGNDPTVLVEAESFQRLGGWQVDSMFVQTMGSPFLIAHGMGQPVSNSQTTVAFAESGDYLVWVRTRNWVPSHPEAPPGRFKIAVNGTDLAPVFGTEIGTWQWQDGGTVTVAGLSADITLKDITGFDGRCDAIVFIKGTNPPPSNDSDLAAWRKAVRNESDVADELDFFLPFIEHIAATPPQNTYRVPVGDTRKYHRIVLEP